MSYFGGAVATKADYQTFLRTWGDYKVANGLADVKPKVKRVAKVRTTEEKAAIALKAKQKRRLVNPVGKSARGLNSNPLMKALMAQLK